MILGGDGEHCVLDVLILINFGFIEGLVEVRRVVVLVSDSDANKFSDWRNKQREKDGVKLMFPNYPPGCFAPTAVFHAKS